MRKLVSSIVAFFSSDIWYAAAGYAMFFSSYIMVILFFKSLVRRH